MIDRAIHWCNQGLPMDGAWERLFRTCLLDGSSQNRIFPAIFSDDELKQIQTPTLLLVGDHEVIYRPQDAIERATRLVPGLCAEIVPSANHIAGISQPDWINKRILRYLRE